MITSDVFWSYAAVFVAGIVGLAQSLIKVQDFFGEYTYCTYAIIMVYGILGMLVCGKQLPSDQLIMWHDKIRMLINNMAIPCYATDIWLKHGIFHEQVVAWIYAMMGCMPALMCILNNNLDPFFIDGLVYANCTTISAVSCQNGNFFGVLGTTCYMIGHHLQRKEQRLFKDEEHPDTAFNLFTTAFVVCAITSLKIPKPTCPPLRKHK